MTIVDSLKAKGSTGGNNIAEAIKNLPMGDGGGGVLIYDLYYDDDNGTYGVHELTYRGVKEAIENHKILLLFGKDHSWYGGGTEGSMDMYMAVGFDAMEEVVEGEVVTVYTARFVGYNGGCSFVSKPLLEETIDSELYAVSD